jgi:hypothetical protein
MLMDLMSREKRKSARRKLAVRVFLYTTTGWPIGECQMRDVSETGARLAHLPEDDLPNELLLSLSRDGRVRRHCALMWRTDREIGVRFRPA